MPIRIVINDHEVTNPVARAAIAGLAVLFALAIVGLVLLVILPLVGLTVGLAFTVVGVALIVAGVLVPVVMLGGTLFAVIAAPFRALADNRRRRRGDPRILPH
jgi:ABC-type transport system involved in cytochrome c biogenesis permease component